MSILISEEHPSNKQPAYICLFEQAESLFEMLLHGKKRADQKVIEVDIAALQEDASLTSVAALNKALSLKALQHRVRPALLLQKELVDAYQRISVRIHKIRTS